MRTIGVVVAALAVSQIARAAPPSGYQCGKGKAVVGKGCACVAGESERRTADNIATCVDVKAERRVRMRQLIADGRRLMAANKFEQAAKKLDEALGIAIDIDPVTPSKHGNFTFSVEHNTLVYDTALAYDRAGNVKNAVIYYRMFVEDPNNESHPRIAPGRKSLSELSGTLEIDSTPACMIYVDGGYELEIVAGHGSGASPLKVANLIPGKYRIRFSNNDVTPKINDDVYAEVKAGQPTKLVKDWSDRKPK